MGDEPNAAARMATARMQASYLERIAREQKEYPPLTPEQRFRTAFNVREMPLPVIASNLATVSEGNEAGIVAFIHAEARMHAALARVIPNYDPRRRPSEQFNKSMKPEQVKAAIDAENAMEKARGAVDGALWKTAQSKLFTKADPGASIKAYDVMRGALEHAGIEQYEISRRTVQEKKPEVPVAPPAPLSAAPSASAGPRPARMGSAR